MKKIIIIIISIFMMISNINATCDENKIKELKSLAKDITYETSYSVSSNTFTVKFYNVFPDMLLQYDTIVRSGDASDSYSATISNINEGERLEINILDSLGCSETLYTIFISIPYYNTFFGTQKCENYVDKLKLCSSKFLSYKLSEEILDDAINSLGNEIKPEVPKQEVKKSFFTKIYEGTRDFLKEWGINIGLFMFFGIITAIVGEKIFRKVKHGI